MGIIGMDRHLPAQPTARFAAKGLQGYRQQASRNLFTRCHNHIIFGWIIKRICFATEIYKSVRVARHGGNDDSHLVTTFRLTFDQLGNTADAFGTGHRRAAKFHYNARHENLQ
jgi:hypothetical protein